MKGAFLCTILNHTQRPADFFHFFVSLTTAK